MRENINSGYDLFGNNCYTAGAMAFNATNPDPWASGLHVGNDPNYSFNKNRDVARSETHVVE